jgi:ABC-type uncharacterized transport system substrate-binding protein
MNRAVFAITFALILLAAPLAAEAQPGGKVPRVGWVWVGRSGWDSSEVAGFRRGLRELGYIEGQNIIVEYRFGEGVPDQLPSLVGELLQLNVDVLVTLGTPVTRVAQRATTTVPIVSQTGDPVGSGFVASLARPGANITGMTVQQGAEGLSGKWPELIKEAVPAVTRVAYLWNPANPPSAANFALVQRVAPALGMTIHSFPVQRPGEFDGAFAHMASARVGALVVDPSPPMIADQARLADLAMKYRLPAISEQRDFVAAGGLMGYGASIFDIARRMAYYVDKILKGAKPADLPVEQASKFELVINLKAAKALGLTIPPAVLARADEVIE